MPEEDDGSLGAGVTGCEPLLVPFLQLPSLHFEQTPRQHLLARSVLALFSLWVSFPELRSEEALFP